MQWSLFLVLTFTSQFHLYTCDDTVTINIEQGELLGKIEKTRLKKQEFYTFKGVPYAHAPLGELRFKPPAAHKGWIETYEAFEEKPACYQYNARTRNNEIRGISGSEDCLYLSVFTSNLQGTAPVIVFDYNDSFRSGFNGSKTYSPEFFIEEDVVVVTINYRLGLFGYLTTDDEIIPGNNGLRDFIVGLQWVRNNIKNFGGDPNRVTLMGSNGGAALIDMLLYSVKAENLFNAAILQSGTATQAIFFPDRPREAAFKLGSLVGINTTDSLTLLKGLQELEAEKLITEAGNVYDYSDFELTQKLVQPFSPVIEKNNPDAILTFLPEDGRIINDVPIIIGLNSREGLDLASHFIFEPNLIRDMSQDFFFHLPRRTEFRFDRNSTVYENAIKEIQNFYLEDGLLQYHNILEYAVYVGDVLQNYASNLAAKNLSKGRKSPTFYYMFDYRGLLNGNSEYMARFTRSSMEHWGATLTDELCYLHLCMNLQKTYSQLYKLPAEQPELKVLKNMVRMWTNFAKYGNPTPNKDDAILKDFVWQPVTKESTNNYLHVTKKLRMKESPLGERENFWDNFITKYSALAKYGLVSDESHDEL